MVNSANSPFCLAITGADDRVLLRDLNEIGETHPFVEWALLYLPEKEGQPRVPTTVWRHQFLDILRNANTALHLCGTQVFRDILSGVIPAEFSRYGRLQLNINARRQEFSNTETLLIYAALLRAGHRIILQCHEATEPLILEFFRDLKGSQFATKVDVLFDASRGLGQQPVSWPAGFQFPLGTRCGYAGGLGPNNVIENLCKIQSVRMCATEYWLDMESGVRTDNEFNLEKVDMVLRSVDCFTDRLTGPCA